MGSDQFFLEEFCLKIILYKLKCERNIDSEAEFFIGNFLCLCFLRFGM